MVFRRCQAAFTSPGAVPPPAMAESFDAAVRRAPAVDMRGAAAWIGWLGPGSRQLAIRAIR